MIVFTLFALAIPCTVVGIVFGAWPVAHFGVIAFGATAVLWAVGSIIEGLTRNANASETLRMTNERRRHRGAM